MASLKYYKNRHNYIQKALYHLFELSRSFRETRVPLIELIVELMHIHGKSQSVQLAATTCIYNLTRQEMPKAIPVQVLSHTVHVILSAMQSYPSTSIVNSLIHC